jgi:hypothetical protein
MITSNYILSDHAREEADRRGISIEILRTIMDSPGQIVDTFGDRKVYQSKVDFSGNLYVVRVIVEMTDPLTVVTVYRTSQIKKYWSDDL